MNTIEIFREGQILLRNFLGIQISLETYFGTYFGTFSHKTFFNILQITLENNYQKRIKKVTNILKKYRMCKRYQKSKKKKRE